MRAWFLGCLLACVTAEPRGHLKPLGGHQDSEGDIKVLEDGFQSSKDFYNDHVITSTPLLWKGAAKTLSAYELWTDEYMSKSHGKELVEVEEGKKEDRDLSMWTEKFGDFLRKYQGKDKKDKFRGNFYSVSALAQGMRKEYNVPRVVDCPTYFVNRAGGMRQINHWFSSGGTSSVLHKDGFENINCLMAGSKDLVFIPPHYSTDDLHWDYRQNHGHSWIDTDKVDLIKYPKFKKIKYFNVHMDQGDCLYIPIGWYHSVRSHSTPENPKNMAINLWWEMAKDDKEKAEVGKVCDRGDVGPGVENQAKTTLASKIQFTREQLPEDPLEDPNAQGYEDDGDDGQDEM